MPPKTAKARHDEKRALDSAPPESSADKKPAPKKISRSVLAAYASYLARELAYHQSQVVMIDQALKVLNEKGVLADGRVEVYDLSTLMRCKVTDL